MMSNKFGILFTSRNNYELLDIWCSKVDTRDYLILNIDEDSTEEQKKLGRQVSKKHNIVYMDREERGMLNNITTACNYYKSKGIEWIMYFSHDCFPRTDNFLDKLNDYLTKNDLTNFGVIGFNVLHGSGEIAQWRGDDTPLMHIARTPLEIGDMYYRNVMFWGNTRVRFDDKWKKPFVVESIMWTAGLLNINQYETHIEPTGEYHMFQSWDDIAFQFLYKNVYNIVLPQFCMAHDQDVKVKFGIPKHSPRGDETVREHFFGKWGMLEVWKERWGFDYGDRNTFENVKEQYEGTLLVDFYNHDPANGPLKSFNI